MILNEEQELPIEEISNNQSENNAGMSRRNFLIFAGSALVLAACGEDEDPTPTPAPQPTVAATATAAIPTAEATEVPKVEASLITPEYLEQLISQEYNDFITKYSEVKTDQNGRERMRIIKTPEKKETVSEGMGYVMLAAANRNDWANFERLFNYVVDYTYSVDAQNPSAGTADKIQRLMPWLINSDWQVEDMNSATDGDMDIAYALLQAAKVHPQYLPFAKDYILEIAKSAIDPKTFILKPDNQPELKKVNPSYIDSGYLGEFARFIFDLEVNPNEKQAMESVVNIFHDAIDKSYHFLDSIISKPDNTTGLVPEWCDLNGDAYSEKDNKCSYNGIRIAWRLSHDYGDAVSLGHLTKINDFFEKTVAAAGGDFSVLKDEYRLNGEIIGKYHNAPIASATAIASLRSDDWDYSLKAIAELIKKKDNNYYNDALRLLALMRIKELGW